MFTTNNRKRWLHGSHGQQVQLFRGLDYENLHLLSEKSEKAFTDIPVIPLVATAEVVGQLIEKSQLLHPFIFYEGHVSRVTPLLNIMLPALTTLLCDPFRP